MVKVDKFIEDYMACPQCEKLQMRYHSNRMEFRTLGCKSCGYTVEDDYVLRMFWEEMFQSGILIKREEKS